MVTVNVGTYFVWPVFPLPFNKLNLFDMYSIKLWKWKVNEHDRKLLLLKAITIVGGVNYIEANPSSSVF